MNHHMQEHQILEGLPIHFHLSVCKLSKYLETFIFHFSLEYLIILFLKLYFWLDIRLDSKYLHSYFIFSLSYSHYQINSSFSPNPHEFFIQASARQFNLPHHQAAFIFTFTSVTLVSPISNSQQVFLFIFTLNHSKTSSSTLPLH